MLAQDCVIYRRESIRSGEANCQHVKVPRQARIDSKTARSRIHARQLLTVMYVLGRRSVPVLSKWKSECTNCELNPFFSQTSYRAINFRYILGLLKHSFCNLGVLFCQVSLLNNWFFICYYTANRKMTLY